MAQVSGISADAWVDDRGDANSAVVGLSFSKAIFGSMNQEQIKTDVLAAGLSPVQGLPKMDDLVAQLLKSYQRPDVHLNNMGCWLPKGETIDQITRLLKDLLFPGFRLEGVTRDNVKYRTGSILDQVYHVLADQIERSLSHPAFGQQCKEYQGEPNIAAKELTTKFLCQLPQLRELLETDVDAAFIGDPACKTRDEVIFCYPGFEAIVIHRLSHLLYGLNVPFIPRMMSELAHQRTGIDIHPGAKIGHHFFIDHGTGVVIGETCDIGNYCKIYQGVTLGAVSFPKDEHGNIVRDQKRHPTLEDNVVIYANATVLGGNTVIGKDAVVGSSVWVTSSVKPQSSVMMEKPRLRIRSKDQPSPADWDYQI